jgi:hypothetical protein
METTECIVLRSDRAEPSEYIAFHYCEFAIFLERYVERRRQTHDLLCFVSSSERRARVSGERNPHTVVRHLCHGAFAALNDESES